MRPASALAWAGLGFAVIIFHLGLIFWGLAPNLVARPLHMALALPWVLVFAATSKSERISGAVLALLGVGGCLWIAVNQSALADQYGFLEGEFQIALAIMLLLVVLEAARRAIGWPLPIIASLALAYGLFGQHIPGEFGHAGTPLKSFLGTLVIAEGGLWGSLTGVSVSVVAIFVIFGAVLNAGEAGQGFMNAASLAAGSLRGGAAKMSVISSALFGSISGSASANVASTGAITLPAMTGLGYPKRLAAAVEAVASSGGQIMPPLMGAGAFVMVELTGVPYTGVMAAAFLPALLYFFAVWVGIDGFAGRHKLPPMPAEDRPGKRDAVITSVFFLIPFGILIWGMFGAGLTPQYAACLAILAGAAMLAVDRRLTFDIKRLISRIEAACITAGRQVALIAAIILCASIIIGVLSITGLGVKITSLILSASGGPALAFPAPDGTCLSDPRHGGADHSRLRHLHIRGRTRPHQPRPGAAAGPSFRLLVRASQHDHAAGLRRRLHRVRHGPGKLAEGRDLRHGARRRPLYHPARNDRQSGLARSRERPAHGSSRCRQGRYRTVRLINRRHRPLAANPPAGHDRLRPAGSSGPNRCAERLMITSSDRKML